jgi:hypothetical protein
MVEKECLPLEKALSQATAVPVRLPVLFLLRCSGDWYRGRFLEVGPMGVLGGMAPQRVGARLERS